MCHKTEKHKISNRKNKIKNPVQTKGGLCLDSIMQMPEELF